MRLKNSYKVYDGPSLLTGDRIIMVVTGLTDPSKNAKTGPMAQCYIMPYAEPPHVAIKSGLDSAVCGDCPLRPITTKLRKNSALRDALSNVKPCYVQTWRGPLSTWKANKDKPVTDPGWVLSIMRHPLREGAWGDPASVPASVWDALRPEICNSYTHQYLTHDLQSRAMASTHTIEDLRRAEIRGYRSFRVISKAEYNRIGSAALDPTEILCPASKEAGARVQCVQCLLCNGKTGPDDRRKNIAIVEHP